MPSETVSALTLTVCCRPAWLPQAFLTQCCQQCLITHVWRSMSHHAATLVPRQQ
jgi:hypothetical protein